MLTIDGLSSGIDTTTVVNGLLQLNQQRLDSLAARRTDLQQKQAAFQSLEAQLLTLRSSVTALSRTQGNPFTRRVAQVSHEDQFSASATARAAPGTYRFQIQALATSHQVASESLSSPDAEITQGTFSLRVGTGQEFTVTIDGSNNTVTGLVEAVNSSGADVSASLIRNDSGGVASYRILLTGLQTGADQQITITNNLAAASGGAIRPDFTQEVQSAGNAQVVLGNGAGAITIESGDNTLDKLIDGVSINLLRASPGEEVSLTVSQDIESGQQAVEDFVQTFNDVLEYIDNQSRFNSETNQAALLQGNSSLLNIQDRLRTAVLSAVPGVNPSANRLSAIGISVTDTGRLSLDSNRLASVLRGDVPGISAKDLETLFSISGTSTHPGVRFVAGSSRTQASSTPYGVDITQAAERARLAAGSAPAASTVIDGTNDELLLSLDGASATLSLTHGTYTAQQLASLLESQINSASEFAGRGVTVALNSGSLSLTSLSYGRESRLSIDGGTAIRHLGFTVGQSAIGTDVAGSYLVNGQTESAVGSGRRLTGNPENENTADLQVEVTLPSSSIVSGVEAEVTVTRGLAARLNDVLSKFLDPVRGDLAIIDDGYRQDLESLQRTSDRQTEIFNQKKDSLLAQFANLESALAKVQSIGNLLGSQLSSLSNLRR